MTRGVHIHVEDAPDTLAVLASVLERRVRCGDWVPGYEATPTGVWVDWEVLRVDGLLSATEVACVDLARGLAVLERSGGPAPHMRSALEAAFGRQLALLEHGYQQWKAVRVAAESARSLPDAP